MARAIAWLREWWPFVALFAAASVQWFVPTRFTEGLAVGVSLAAMLLGEVLRRHRRERERALAELAARYVELSAIAGDLFERAEALDGAAERYVVAWVLREQEHRPMGQG